MRRARSILLAVLVAGALAGCTDPAAEFRTTCEELEARACPAGCASTADCTALWDEAAALDVGDVLESCIATCPRLTCESDTYFDCGCYGACVREAPVAVQDAVVRATRCDRDGVPTECALP